MFFNCKNVGINRKVGLTMSKKQFMDEDGNKFVQVTPWYKHISTWIIAVLSLALVFSLVGKTSSGSSAPDKAASKVTVHKTTGSKAVDKTAKVAKTTNNTVTAGEKKYNVAGTKSYKVNYSDSNWSAASIKVDKVTIYKLSKAYKYKSENDGTFQINGFVRIHVSVSPKRDIEAYSTQGTVIYKNGEQHEGDMLENWDGEIAKGATKSGNVTFPVEKLASVSSLKNIRYKFDAFYDTDDDDDDNSNYTYDMILNFKN